MSTAVDHEIIVVGAGFSGIGAAIKLARAGFSDFVVLDEADGVGGTWHWNTYPGVAVDIPSFSYQFSFEKRSDWSRVYAPGRELKLYAEHCTDKYGVRDHMRLNTRVTGCRLRRGRERVARGPRRRAPPDGAFRDRRHGGLHPAEAARDRGREPFAGPTSAHRALGPLRASCEGRRVAVIGTGASAIQLIPAVAPEVGRLTVFQRTPIWCLPKLDAPLSERARAVLRWVPGRDARRALAQPDVRRADVRARRPLRGHLPVPAQTRRSGSPQAARRRGGPAGARSAHPQLQARLQAPEFLQRVRADLQPRERGARDGCHRVDHAAGDPHRRRRRARG